VIGTRTEFPTRRLAERQFETLLARINAPSYRPGRIASLAEFADRWRREVLIHHKPSSIKAANSHLHCHILPLLGKTKLEELGLEVQQGFITRLAEAVARKTAINVMGTLSVMLSTAKNWGYICEPVEFAKLTMPKEEVKEDARFFTAAEAKQIISTAEEPFRTMFAIAAMTGLRAGELLALLAGKDVLVGAIDVASAEVETAKEVAATIEDALRFVPPERLYPCTNCGMAPLDRTLAAQKLAALAAGAALVRGRL